MCIATVEGVLALGNTAYVQYDIAGADIDFYIRDQFRFPTFDDVSKMAEAHFNAFFFFFPQYQLRLSVIRFSRLCSFHVSSSFFQARHLACAP